MDSVECAVGPCGRAHMIFFAPGPGDGSALSDVLLCLYMRV